MKTQVLKPDDENIRLAGELLKKGELVAAGTETVYGLFADAYNGKAVKKIFEAKGRPQDNPLLAHIDSIEMMMDGLVSDFPEDAKKIADAFWPGPISMILPKGEKVSDETSAGLDTVGVRMPSNEIARRIIHEAGVPLAGPSANLSGKPSPTTAQDTFVDLNGRVPLIIDNGRCPYGVESTVISVLGDKPVLLRPGFITKEEIEEVLQKEVHVSEAILGQLKEGEKAASPGMKYKHYAPKANLTLVCGEFEDYIRYVENHPGENTYCMCFDGEEDKCPMPAITYGKKEDGAEQAHQLFYVLRELDRKGAQTVYVRCEKIDGIYLAVYNRLIRASAFRIIHVSD
jgi:L-threonylcarbamoyladenylate synthase